MRVEADLTERAIHETVKKNGRKSTGEPRTGDDVVIDLEDDESVQFFAKMARNLPNVVPQVDVGALARGTEAHVWHDHVLHEREGTGFDLRLAPRREVRVPHLEPS